MIFSVILMGAMGCGGGAGPSDMAGLTDLASGSTDLAGGGSGDLADCSEPTSGFYVLSNGRLILVSPDPNSWDSGKGIAIVDANGNSVPVDFMTVAGGNFYFDLAGSIYSAAVSSIQNGKLTVSLPSKISDNNLADTYGVLAQNAGKGTGDLVIEFSSISGRVGELQVGSSTSVITPASPELQLSCALVDFEGAVGGDSYNLTAACGTDIITIVNGMMTGTSASGTNALAGMQVYQGITYVMDKAGNLYDSGLHLIKKTRLCLPMGNPGRGQSISVDSM